MLIGDYILQNLDKIASVANKNKVDAIKRLRQAFDVDGASKGLDPFGNEQYHGTLSLVNAKSYVELAMHIKALHDQLERLQASNRDDSRHDSRHDSRPQQPTLGDLLKAKLGG